VQQRHVLAARELVCEDMSVDEPLIAGARLPADVDAYQQLVGGLMEDWQVRYVPRSSCRLGAKTQQLFHAIIGLH
jgi:hypothetical protein